MSVTRPLVPPLASLAVLAVAALAVAACSADRVGAPAAPRAAASAPRLAAGVVSAPHFLQPAAGAPTIANPVVQFWAKRGVDRTVEMFYHPAPGAPDSVTFFSLRVRAKSLWKRPDGTTIADGDSVRITLRLVDAQRGIVDCQPAGLLFSPKAPARVKVSFAEADADLNQDGRVDGTDAAITRALAVWRQETPSDPWLPVPSDVYVGAHEVEAEIGGFTGYAIAW